MTKVDELAELECEACNCVELPSAKSIRVPVGCDAKTLGEIGESVALGYLADRGFEVIDRNYRTRYGEADLVCRDNGDLVLVEVKTRRGALCFPEEAVGRDKIKRYGNIMLEFLQHREVPRKVRFDVIALNLCFQERCHLVHYVGVCTWVG